MRHGEAFLVGVLTARKVVRHVVPQKWGISLCGRTVAPGIHPLADAEALRMSGLRLAGGVPGKLGALVAEFRRA
ncbi:hypothetical protein RE9431_22520 [Prescottella equi]|nr:hypothetical protein RE9416_22420 [Prescottella equi]BCN53962.1 hypothetical protein RE9425_23520 [Prescottella equi]BCN58914.1 hypothetical protein RE9427_22840 [Prescottella equi]BCN63797.1 hypothetical protein RE9431_22520 [Prescottella equi]BCN68738.1 hypothetical protein RE943_22110 [Prescottella equi]